MRSPLYAFNLDRDIRMFSFAERSGCFFIDRSVLLFTGGIPKGTLWKKDSPVSRRTLWNLTPSGEK